MTIHAEAEGLRRRRIDDRPNAPLAPRRGRILQDVNAATARRPFVVGIVDVNAGVGMALDEEEGRVQQPLEFRFRSGERRLLGGSAVRSKCGAAEDEANRTNEIIGCATARAVACLSFGRERAGKGGRKSGDGPKLPHPTLPLGGERRFADGSFCVFSFRPPRCRLWRRSFDQQFRPSPAQAFQLLLLFRTERAGALGVGVHPGDEPVEAGAVEFHAMVTGGIGELAQDGAAHGGILAFGRNAFAVGGQHELIQTRLAGMGERFVGVVRREIELRGFHVVALRVVATDALRIEHGLDEFVEAHRPRAFRGRR